MKKTLIAMFALAGVAMADTTEEFTTDIMQTGKYADGAWNYTTTSWGDTDILKLTDSSMVVNITKLDTATCSTNNAYTQSFAVANTNTGKTGTYNYILTFTASFGENVKAITLSSITLDIFSLTGGGEAQDMAKNIKGSVSLVTETESSPLGTAGFSTDIAKSANTAAVYSHSEETGDYTLVDGQLGAQITLNLQDVELVNGQEYQLKLTNVARVSDKGGTLTGIGNVAFAGTYTTTIPEPATATLSLLALAGLAARRRRH